MSDQKYIKASFKKILANNVFTNDAHTEDRPQVKHCWGYKINAKVGTACYVLEIEASDTKYIYYQFKHKTTGELQSHSEYFTNPEWERTETKTIKIHHTPRSFLVLWNGYVASMNVAAAKEYLRAERKNGKLVYDETGAAARAHDRYRFEMTR